MIKFKSSSLYTNKVTIKAKPFDWQLFEKQVELFNQHWYTVKVHYDFQLGDPGIDVVFTHANVDVCYEAATGFVTHVREFDWWVEE